MITTRYALAAVRVLHDSESNRMSAIDLMEELRATSFPILIPRMSLVWNLRRDTTDADQFEAVVALSIGDRVLHEFSINVDFQGGPFTRATLTIGGFAIAEPGTLVATWRAPGVEPVSYRIDVVAEPGVVDEAGRAATVLV